MKYSCPRCGYETNILSNMKKHFMRKQICENILNNDESIEEIRDSFNPSTYAYVCIGCQKKFRTPQDIYEHQNICVAYKKLKLNNFGSEDISHILNDEEFLNKCVFCVKSGLVSIVEKIYYDKDKPQNKTVLMKSVQRDTLVIHENGEWKIRHVNDIVPKMLLKGASILSNYLYKKPIPSIEDDKHRAFVMKQLYLYAMYEQTKPEFYMASSSVKAIIENYRAD